MSALSLWQKSWKCDVKNKYRYSEYMQEYIRDRESFEKKWKGRYMIIIFSASLSIGARLVVIKYYCRSWIFCVSTRFSGEGELEIPMVQCQCIRIDKRTSQKGSWFEFKCGAPNLFNVLMKTCHNTWGFVWRAQTLANDILLKNN